MEVQLENSPHKTLVCVGAPGAVGIREGLCPDLPPLFSFMVFVTLLCGTAAWVKEESSSLKRYKSISASVL